MRRSLIVLPVLAGALAACGGGPSKAEFLAAADATCEPSNRTVAGAPPSARADLASAAGRITAAIDSQLIELRKLDTPGGETASQVKALWVSMAGVGEAAGVLQRSATTNEDAVAAQAMRDTAARFQATSSQAQVLGFTSCAVGMKPAVDQLTGGTKVVLKASYLAKGDSFCDAAKRTVDAVPEPVKSLPAIARYFDRILPPVEKAMNELRALPAPPGDEVVVAEMNDAQARAVAKAREFRNAVMAGDPGRILALEPEFDQLTTMADAKMVAYGFKTCGAG